MRHSNNVASPRLQEKLPATKPYVLRDDESIEVMALVEKLNQIASDLDRLVDGTLPPETQTNWCRLRHAVSEMVADLRRLHRWNRW